MKKNAFVICFYWEVRIICLLPEGRGSRYLRSVLFVYFIFLASSTAMWSERSWSCWGRPQRFKNSFYFSNLHIYIIFFFFLLLLLLFFYSNFPLSLYNWGFLDFLIPRYFLLWTLFILQIYSSYLNSSYYSTGRIVVPWVPSRKKQAWDGSAVVFNILLSARDKIQNSQCDGITAWSVV